MLIWSDWKLLSLFIQFCNFSFQFFYNLTILLLQFFDKCLMIRENVLNLMNLNGKNVIKWNHFFTGDDLQASHSRSAESLHNEEDILPIVRRQIHNCSALISSRSFFSLVQNLEPAPAPNLEPIFSAPAPNLEPIFFSSSSKFRADLFSSKSRAELFQLQLQIRADLF